ncbi:sodium/potassium-transporting ATPase subunit beta-1-interacting protein 4 [Felis catus]|uniref:sodium/potassium-transporting ATPase subunit beta-1-interacting protein 4 n=1 Tax=Felis catus TaxID=9685 RepID=UPI001D19E9D1|nr:sodium/potassium-transporting ATPase subunit beta-1-interacting protein 4 [Felis catus]
MEVGESSVQRAGGGGVPPAAGAGTLWPWPPGAKINGLKLKCRLLCCPGAADPGTQRLRPDTCPVVGWGRSSCEWSLWVPGWGSRAPRSPPRPPLPAKSRARLVHPQPLSTSWHAVWTAVWVTWNVFIICFYLETGGCQSKLLTFHLPRHRSWWPLDGQALVPGIGCALCPGARLQRGPVDPGVVSLAGELLPDQAPDALVAVANPIHSAQDGLLGWVLGTSSLARGLVSPTGELVGFVYGCYVVSVFTEEDSCFDFIGGFDPFLLYHVSEKPSNLLCKQASLEVWPSEPAPGWA